MSLETLLRRRRTEHMRENNIIRGAVGLLEHLPESGSDKLNGACGLVFPDVCALKRLPPVVGR